MPWKELPVPELRFAFVQAVRITGMSVSEACARYGISRKTGYKWLHRFDQQPHVPLDNLSRKPRGSPNKTSAAFEATVLELRDRYSWGPVTLRAFLAARQRSVPCVRTIANILTRHGRVRPAPPHPVPQPFERPVPNDLWQCDFKGHTEVTRQRAYTFTVLDDHSRYLLQARAARNVTMPTAFGMLWETFSEYGLPRQMLCDRAFGGIFRHASISWFESRLARLGVDCIHGRAYHPQTQGKIERLHRTLQDELWPRIRRDTLEQFNADLYAYRLRVYNSLRPHQALGLKTPLSRYAPSPRPCPARLPDLEYPGDAVLRKVSPTGDIRWNYCRILVGRGVAGDLVRIEERAHEVAVFYAQKEVRCIAFTELKRDTFI